MEIRAAARNWARMAPSTTSNIVTKEWNKCIWIEKTYRYELIQCNTNWDVWRRIAELYKCHVQAVGHKVGSTRDLRCTPGLELTIVANLANKTTHTHVLLGGVTGSVPGSQLMLRSVWPLYYIATRVGQLGDWGSVVRGRTGAKWGTLVIAWWNWFWCTFGRRSGKVLWG